MYNQKGPKGRFLWIPLVVVMVVLVLGGAVMLLWNAVLVPVAGFRALSFWQALGLLVLCRILFGRLIPGSSPGRHRGGPWREKWMHMDPEERERFQDEWKKRGGSWRKPGSSE